MRVCFFAAVAGLETLDRIEFYKQDLEILRSLGHEVVVATKWGEVALDVDFYYAWWWQWGFVPMGKSFFRKRPYIVTGVANLSLPTMQDYYHRPGWQRWLMRYAFQHATANVFLSEFERVQVSQALPVANPVYVPCCVRSDIFSPGGGEREDFVLTVATLWEHIVPRKCILEILKAIPLVVRKHPGIRFLIAGEKGSGFHLVEAQLRELGLGDRVEFLGVISQEKKIELMQRCKVYLSPSRYEGFGLAILEAMSCGAAVVSSPVGAVPEVVGEAGLLVDGASPAQIAGAVCRYLDDPALRKEMGAAARARAERLFSFARKKEMMEKVIADAMAR